VARHGEKQFVRKTYILLKSARIRAMVRLMRRASTRTLSRTFVYLFSYSSDCSGCRLQWILYIPAPLAGRPLSLLIDRRIQARPPQLSCSNAPRLRLSLPDLSRASALAHPVLNTCFTCVAGWAVRYSAQLFKIPLLCIRIL